MFGLKQRVEAWIRQRAATPLEPAATEALPATPEVPFSAPGLEHWALHVGQGWPGENVFSECAACREVDFRQPYFAYWVGRMNAYIALHRKLWEFVYICQGLHERGLLAEGRKGVGFGVGGETLPALFASLGCEILATDIDVAEAAAAGWAATDQHAASREALRRPDLCSDEVFDRLVSFRTCDMNAVPRSIREFDFCWSACALEHLGSIEKGLAFVERSLDCLKPGGFAIHTTEFNVSSNTATVDHEGTVLFRRQDLERLSKRLSVAGHKVAPLNFDPGAGVIDNYVDVAPYKAQPHLKLALLGYVSTSYGIIVQKAG
jgi:hypothetical protein